MQIPAVDNTAGSSESPLPQTYPGDPLRNLCFGVAVVQLKEIVQRLCFSRLQFLQHRPASITPAPINTAIGSPCSLPHTESRPERHRRSITIGYSRAGPSVSGPSRQNRRDLTAGSHKTLSTFSGSASASDNPANMSRAHMTRQQYPATVRAILAKRFQQTGTSIRIEQVRSLIHQTPFCCGARFVRFHDRSAKQSMPAINGAIVVATQPRSTTRKSKYPVVPGQPLSVAAR